MIKNFLKEGLLLLMLSMSMVTMAADIDYWTKATVITVVKGGTVTPSAGMVYARPTAAATEADIAATMGSYIADPVKMTGASGTSAVNKEWFFYAKANAGYKFIGFASSATGTPSGSGAVAGMSMMGSYYQYSAKSGAGWNANTEATAKDVKRYAVFEKDESAPVVIDVEGLPRYAAYTATPSTEGKVKCVRELTIAFNDPTYDDPIGIMPTYDKVVVNRIDGGSKTPVEVEATPAVKNGQLVISFEPAIADTMTVEIVIPEAMTNNVLAPIALMSKDELREEGYCTNPQITLTYQIEPGVVRLLTVTNQTDSVVLPNSVLDPADYNHNVKIIYLRYEDELSSCVSSASFPDYVHIYREEGEEKIPIRLNTNLPASETLGVLKYDESKHANVRDYHYLPLRLSGDNYIDSTDVCGRYQVEVLPGLARNIDGQKTEGTKFTFVYGHEVEAREPINPDNYLGYYEAQIGDTKNDKQTFSFIKQNEKYYISQLMGSSLLLSVTGSGTVYHTQDAEQDGEYIHFLEQPARVKFANENTIILPAFYFKTPGQEEVLYLDGNYQRKKTTTDQRYNSLPAQAVKQIRNGQLLIVREDKVFTIEGKELR